MKKSVDVYLEMINFDMMTVESFFIAIHLRNARWKYPNRYNVCNEKNQNLRNRKQKEKTCGKLRKELTLIGYIQFLRR